MANQLESNDKTNDIEYDLYRIETCRFKREENSKWENGFLLNEGNLRILDMKGKIVDDVWDYHNISNFALTVTKELFN